MARYSLSAAALLSAGDSLAAMSAMSAMSDQATAGGSSWLQPAVLLLYLVLLVGGGMLLLRGRRILQHMRDTEARYRVFYDLAPVAMVVHDQQHRIRDWNRAAEKLFGWSREQALGQDFFDLLAPGETLTEMRGAVDATLKTTVRSTMMNWSVRQDGHEVLCDWSHSVIKNAHGGVTAVVSLAIDVTGAREFERRLRDSERRFRSLAENAYDVIWTATLDGRITYASPSVERLIGYTPAALREYHVFDAVPAESAAQIRDALEQLRTRGVQPQRHWEVQQRRQDGRWIWVQVTMDVLRGENGAPREILGITRDVTEQREVQETLRTRVTAIESAAEGVIITDAAGRMEYVNPAYVQLTGFSVENSLGKRPAALLDDANEPGALFREISETVRRGEVWRGEINRWNLTEPERIASVTVSPVTDDDGRLLRLVAIMRDVSAYKAMELRLTKMAHYDSLTGLPNRRLFFDRLADRLRLAQRQGRELALLFIDLDGFKAINDTLGHAAGDEVLRAVAGRFTEVLRTSDSLARVAGDEFTVVLGPGAEPADAEQVASRLLESLSMPVLVSGAQCQLGASIGIARYPLHALDADALLKIADQAMYAAKRGGRNRYVLHPGGQPEALSGTG